jgi:uncharacterized protein (TIGR02118 family)
MHKLLGLYPHPTSPEHFRRYYVETHLPLAAKLPGLRASRHAFDLEGMGAPSPYFCVWEGEFDSFEAIGSALGSPIGQEVSADVANYATGGVLIMHCSPVAGVNG